MSYNSSLPPSNTMYTFLQHCLAFPAAIHSFTAFTIGNTLVCFPLCVYVLYLGVRRQQRPGAAPSHSDAFAYNMASVELLNVLGSGLMCCGVKTAAPKVVTVGIHLYVINTIGQISFHLLTCMERYLAVVHPVTYLSLKNAKGVRIRKIATVTVLLAGVALGIVMSTKDQESSNKVTFCILGFSLAVILFCSVSVLCVLIRPGPGEGGGGRNQVDQSKLRAFYTIKAILGVLVVRFVGNLMVTAMATLPHMAPDAKCVVSLSLAWFSFPSSLVSPLLFLQRAGKLRRSK